MVLLLFALLYAGLQCNSLKQKSIWISVSLVLYGFVAAATPILCYIIFNREDYARYETSFIQSFWQAVRGHPSPTDMAGYFSQLRNCFFGLGRFRFLLPDVLPIPLPYYFFLLPGLVIALRRKRYEIVLLAVLPVIGAFIAFCFENRLLLAIPFWVILMAFAIDSLLKLEIRSNLKITLWGASAVMLIAALVPSIQYLRRKTKNPFSIRYYAQEQVAAARFLRRIVAGAQPVNTPRLERDEFNQIEDVPDASFETFVCQKDAYSSIHLFLHDYDDKKILSFCADLPFNVMNEREIWSANKKALLAYVPGVKDLKLIWERDPKTDRITKLFDQFLDLGTEESISYSFSGREKKFYVLNIGSQHIRQFQERVRTLPDSLL